MLLEYAPELLMLPIILFISGNIKTSIVVLCILLFLFRKNNEEFIKNDNYILSPADGVVDDVFTDENGDISVSIFLNFYDRHYQLAPVSGIVKSIKYFPGKFDYAWNKVDTKNERVETIISNNKIGDVKIIQIAGYVFRRIINILKEKSVVSQTDFMGLIKLSSKVILTFPKNLKLNVKINDRIKIGDKISYLDI